MPDSMRNSLDSVDVHSINRSQSATKLGNRNNRSDSPRNGLDPRLQSMVIDIRPEDLDSLTCPTKRWGHAAVEADGKMYILGGYDGEYLGDIWQFDPE